MMVSLTFIDGSSVISKSYHINEYVYVIHKSHAYTLTACEILQDRLNANDYTLIFFILCNIPCWSENNNMISLDDVLHVMEMTNLYLHFCSTSNTTDKFLV